MRKKRADVVLYEKGLVESREKAKRLIMEGTVYVGEKRIDKPGEKIHIDELIEIKKNPLPYVSRGGLKLEKAIKSFNIDFKNKNTMDIGASTGGFTDCMLQYGAKKVYALDVGYGQLDWKLRKDPRVIIKERTNIRYIVKEDIGETFDFITIDVSFISLKLVLPVAKELLSDGGGIIALIKPQFEAGRDKVGKKGIVRDKETHIDVIKSIKQFCDSINLNLIGLDYSPITGTTGNIEFLSYISKDMNKKAIQDIEIISTVDEAHSLL